MRLIFHLSVMLLIALAVGFGASYYALTDGRFFGTLSVGPWAGWPQIGIQDPDPYTRAYLARSGLLQLGQSEGIRLVANRDSDDMPLERACTYRVTGGTPGATFWTLVATTPDNTIVATSEDLTYLHSERVVYDSEGTVTLHVGPHLAPGNWLPTSGTGPFQLVMTFYDPAGVPGGGAALDTMPEIERRDCP